MGAFGAEAHGQSLVNYGHALGKTSGTLTLSSSSALLPDMSSCTMRYCFVTGPKVRGPTNHRHTETSRAGEMAQWLRAPTVLLEVLSSIPSNHHDGSQPSVMGSDAPLLVHLKRTMVYSYT